MNYNTDRRWARNNELLFHTYEMVDWLQAKTGFPDEISEALLGAWVGVLRYEALSRAERDEGILSRFQDGHGRLCLNEELAPEGWGNEDLWTQASHETGLPREQACFLLHLIRDKLYELNGQKAFEPVGWFEVEDESSESKFLVHCWQDFLQPLADEDEPREEVLGVVHAGAESE